MFHYIGGAVLIVVLGIGWEIFQVYGHLYKVEYRAGSDTNDTVEVRYQHNEKDVESGEVDVPWKRRLETRDIRALRVNVTGGWCEIRIDGEVCDREESGSWCSCYDGEGT